MTLSNIYLDGTNGDDTKTGEDWDNAVKTWTDALSNVSSGGTVHTRAGAYSISSGVLTTKSVGIKPYFRLNTGTTVTNGDRDYWGSNAGVTMEVHNESLGTDVMTKYELDFLTNERESGGSISGAGMRMYVVEPTGTAKQYKVIYKGDFVNLTGAASTHKFYTLYDDSDGIKLNSNSRIGLEVHASTDEKLRPSKAIAVNQTLSPTGMSYSFPDSNAPYDVGDTFTLDYSISSGSPLWCKITRNTIATGGDCVTFS